MRLALIDSTPDPKVYSLPLLKIGAWRKDLGDECELFQNELPESDAFDEIWISTIFTFDLPHAMGLVKEAVNRADHVRVGGISATLLPRYFEDFDCDVHSGLIPEAEAYAPDYSLLDKPPNYSITHTSRGCVRDCEFCMVSKLEPEFIDRPHWTDDLYPDASKILFYDNNWLAKPHAELERDVEHIQRLYDFRKIDKIDFNQALDARLLTESKTDLLEGLPIHPVRFAFDTMEDDGHYQKAVRMMVDRGFNIFMSYVLYNYKDTPQDFYYRLKESVRLTEELQVAVDSFPMCYHPVMQPDPKEEYVGEHWTLTKRRAFTAILAAISGPTGTFTFHSKNTQWTPMEEFEYWLGKSADEFDRLLSYPKIRKLLKVRKGKMRMMRAQED